MWFNPKPREQLTGAFSGVKMMPFSHGNNNNKYNSYTHKSNNGKIINNNNDDDDENMTLAPDLCAPDREFLELVVQRQQHDAVVVTPHDDSLLVAQKHNATVTLCASNYDCSVHGTAAVQGTDAEALWAGAAFVPAVGMCVNAVRSHTLLARVACCWRLAWPCVARA